MLRAQDRALLGEPIEFTLDNLDCSVDVVQLWTSIPLASDPP